MPMYSRSFILPTILILILSNSLLFAQQFLDEMDLEDISDNPEIKTTIVRDPSLALLIVKSAIKNLRFQSNNKIENVEEKEPGKWVIQLVPGTHRIIFQSETFLSIHKRYFFKAKEVKGVKLTLATEKREVKDSGILVLKSEQPDLEVYINDELHGLTPFQERLSAGVYTLEVMKKFHIPHKQQITIETNDILPLTVILEPKKGKVIITSEPSRVPVELDGKTIGNTPLFLDKILLGRHRIKIEEQKFIIIDEQFELTEERDSLYFNYPLALKEYILSFQGSPGNAEVKIDGNKVGYLPIEELKMNYGEYNLNINKPGFYKYDKSIALKKNQPYNFNINLQPKSKGLATLFSCLIPGSGQYYSDREIMGILLGAASIGGAVTSFILNSQYKDKKDTYFVNKNDYEQNIELSKMANLYSTLKDSHQNMEGTYNKSRIIMGVTAAIWLYNIVDTFLFFPNQGNLNVNVSSNEKRAKLSINLNL